MSNIPSDLKYAKSHEWVRVSGTQATVGITDHAQSELTDVVFVELPALGKKVKAGEACAEAGPLVAGIDPRSAASSSVEGIERLIGLAGESATPSANPDDLDARWGQATSAIGRADFAAALDQLLEIVSRNRKFKDDGARLAMLGIFDQLGGEDPLTQDYRRRLQIVI